MTLRALSQTPFAARLMEGQSTHGVSLGHGHLLFPIGVLSLTRPGEPRMPNGIECALPVPEIHEPVRVGEGRLECGCGTVYTGTTWHPRPRPRFRVSTHPSLPLRDLLAMAGQGPGLTPLADDIVAGYLGARALFGVGRSAAVALAGTLAAQTTSLSGTLLRLAAHGHLPEAAHHLLEDGEPGPLLNWGASSGSGLLVGLGLYRPASWPDVVQRLDLTLPLDLPRLRVEIRPAA